MGKLRKDQGVNKKVLNNDETKITNNNYDIDCVILFVSFLETKSHK